MNVVLLLPLPPEGHPLCFCRQNGLEASSFFFKREEKGPSINQVIDSSTREGKKSPQSSQAVSRMNARAIDTDRVRAV